MKVLVTYASRHHSTAAMAEAIAEGLRAHLAGAIDNVEVLPVHDVDDVAGYDAVVIGSAVYSGRWLASARSFVLDNVEALRSRPVWLFCTGPIGDPPAPLEEAVDLAELADLVDAEGTRTFLGRLRHADLEIWEQEAVRAVHSADGDYRDWDAVRAWAEVVAGTLDDPDTPVGSASGLRSGQETVMPSAGRSVPSAVRNGMSARATNTSRVNTDSPYPNRSTMPRR